MKNADDQDAKALEAGAEFMPRFDAAGLLTAVVTAAGDGALLMVAHMNKQAIEKTLETGIAHFWSRSRQRLWMKGESSGNTLKIKEIRVDCDQDALWLIAEPAGPVCHTNAQSCFYRRLNADGLEPVD